jgi:hypothetical protein
MPHHVMRVAASPFALALVPALVAVAGLPACAAAATITPNSATTCYGSLAHDPTGKASGEPNLLDYKFFCNENIVAYTVLVTRGRGWSSTIDDYNSSPLVVDSDGTTSATEAPGCAGTTPGLGINCNIGTGAQIDAFNTVEGSIDPIGTYCPYYPTGAKKDSRPVPEAQVELIVSDYTGAEDGPFPLAVKQACSVPTGPWAKVKTAKHKSAKTTGKGLTKKPKHD